MNKIKELFHKIEDIRVKLNKATLQSNDDVTKSLLIKLADLTVQYETMKGNYEKVS